MAVKLRLTRRGKKKQPTYRVVAAEARFARDGRFIEIIGFYDPRTDPSDIRIDSEKALKWLRNGAQPSERVKKLLETSGVWEEFTGVAPTIIPSKPKSEKRAAKKKAEEAAQPPAEAKDEAQTKEEVKGEEAKEDTETKEEAAPEESPQKEIKTEVKAEPKKEDTPVEKEEPPVKSEESKDE